MNRAEGIMPVKNAEEEGACVYLSPQGEAYHSSRDCSGLTRHVEMVKKSEVAHKGECSRCAGR